MLLGVSVPSAAVELCTGCRGINLPLMPAAISPSEPARTRDMFPGKGAPGTVAVDPDVA